MSAEEYKEAWDKAYEEGTVYARKLIEDELAKQNPEDPKQWLINYCSSWIALRRADARVKP